MVWWSACLSPFARRSAAPLHRLSSCALTCANSVWFFRSNMLIIARCMFDTSGHICSPRGSQVKKWLRLPKYKPLVTSSMLQSGGGMTHMLVVSSSIPSFSQVPWSAHNTSDSVSLCCCPAKASPIKYSRCLLLLAFLSPSIPRRFSFAAVARDTGSVH